MGAAKLAEVATSHFPFVAACSYPVRDGNFVHPLIDGAPALDRKSVV